MSKTEIGYRSLFEKNLSLVGVMPSNILVDFERGLINSTKFVFTSSDVFGCNFHFGQIIWRKIQNLGLGTFYKEFTWQRKTIRRCFQLAFIPCNLILREFEKILFDVNESNNDENILNFLLYFRRQFIGGDINQEPSYEKIFWSCYQRVINSIPRTTNSLEGWHRQLNSSFNRSHLNLASFVNVLAREEQRIFVKLTQIKFGNYIEVVTSDFKKEYELKVVCENFYEFDLKNFLKLIDRLISFKTE